MVAAAALVAAEKPGLSDLKWLEGRWSGSQGARVNEEFFTGAAGGSLAFLFRMTEGQKTLIVESGTITAKDGDVWLRMRPFGPEMQAYGELLELRLASWDGTTAEFVNPKHTKPKRTLLKRAGSDGLDVRSEIVWDSGKEEVHEISMKRVVR